VPSALVSSHWRVEDFCTRKSKTASATWRNCPVTIADLGGICMLRGLVSRLLASAQSSCTSPGRAVARTGLRMMPTFPPLPLKFRTAGFPSVRLQGRYIGRAFLSSTSSSRRAVCIRPSCTSLPVTSYPRSESGGRGALMHHRSSGPSRFTPGALAPVRVIVSRSIIT